MRPKWIRTIAGLAAVAFLAGGVAAVDAQTRGNRAKSAADCQPANAPAKIEGEIVAVDHNEGKVTLRARDGQTHEFRGDKDTVRDYKVGDRVELNKRAAQNC